MNEKWSLQIFIYGIDEEYFIIHVIVDLSSYVGKKKLLKWTHLVIYLAEYPQRRVFRRCLQSLSKRGPIKQKN